MKYIAEFLKINDQLNRISEAQTVADHKLNQILTIHADVKLKINPDVLALPRHLQQTVLALNQLGKATASDVAAKTGKVRSVESGYLNQLVNQQYVIKLRNGRQVIFCLRNLK